MRKVISFFLIVLAVYGFLLGLSNGGTDASLYYEEDENHFIMAHKKNEIMDFLNNELFS